MVITANVRAQTLEREVTVPGWEGGKHRSAAIRDFAQDVDENQCRAQNLEREVTVPGWEGGKHRSAAVRDFAQDVDERGHRAQSSNGELTVQPRPQDVERAVALPRLGGHCWSLRKTMFGSLTDAKGFRKSLKPAPRCIQFE